MYAMASVSKRSLELLKVSTINTVASEGGGDPSQSLFNACWHKPGKVYIKLGHFGFADNAQIT